MSVAEVIKEAEGMDLETVVIVGTTKDGGIRMLSFPDNTLVANWLLNTGSYSLHQFALTKDDRK
jgi:hypothetical protein